VDSVTWVWSWCDSRANAAGQSCCVSITSISIFYFNWSFQLFHYQWLLDLIFHPVKFNLRCRLLQMLAVLLCHQKFNTEFLKKYFWKVFNTFGLKKYYQYQYQYLLVKLWAIPVPIQINKTAELSQRRPRDAPNISVPWKASRVLTTHLATFPEICNGL